MRTHFACFAALLLPLALGGCALTSTAPATPESYQGASIQGQMHGGQSPINGAHVYLMQANTTGYGQPSLSILTTGDGTDAIGTYVLTKATGYFSITGDYNCTANTQVYLYGLGGDPGGGVNSASGLLAALGNCPASGSFVASIPNVQINEITTVAAAYAFAGFATDAVHVSSSGTTLAQVGIANAFLNASNLASLATGQAYSTTPGGFGTAPQTLVGTLGNILASCVNSVGPSSVGCATLFGAATSTGTTSGTAATDTATAAIYIAHHPGANITTLYNLQTAAAPFATALTTQPNDFTLALTFRGNQPGTGGGLVAPEGVAIDAAGNAWMTGFGSVYGNPGTLCEFSSLGVDLSSNSTLGTPCWYGGGGLDEPFALAIDTGGNIWMANSQSNSLTEYSSAGVPLSPAAGYTGGGINHPHGVAIDTAGNVWTADTNGNSLSELSPAGVAISPAAGYTGGGLLEPGGLAFDGAGNIWASNLTYDPTAYTYSISELTGAGVPISPSNGYIGGGLGIPENIAIDSAGDAWVPNINSNSPPPLTEFSAAGVPLVEAAQFPGSTNDSIAVAIDGSGNVWQALYYATTPTLCEYNSAGVAISGTAGYTSILATYSPKPSGPEPNTVAIDGSGDVWMEGNTFLGLIEYIGVATPVVTPIVANLLPPYGKPASKP